ncbi:Ig-like domain-containing protein, partial [Patescibacteria group bacterium]|nr:Ig-like domain-containing protein [Patescibacteria group bacterium]
MRKIFKILFFLFAITSLLLVTAPLAQAQIIDQGLAEIGETAGYGEANLPEVIGRIIRIALSLLGLAAVIIMITGGFFWLTSGGAPDKVVKAKKIITSGFIGLVIILSSYAIVSFVLLRFSGITGPGGPGGPGGPPGGYLPPDAFKVRKIETTHGGLTQNYQQDVFLCSAVQPIFNHRLNGGKIQDLAAANELRVETDGVLFDGAWYTRNNALIFKHPDLFDIFTSYSAYFPKEILDSRGSTLQACLAAGGCQETDSYFIWNFDTGESTDIIVPEIVTTSPIFDLTDDNYPDQNVSRKPTIRVNFSEPIDITTIMDEDLYPIQENIWVAELDGQGGPIIEILLKEFWQVEISDQGFRLNLTNDNLLKSFTWYRIHIENIEDLCMNKMATPMEWEFQTNDQAPGVTSWNPTGDQSCPDSNITVGFDTPMYDYKVRMTITGGEDNFTFDMRPSEVGEPYFKEIWDATNKLGVFSVLDPGEGSNNFRVFSFNPENNLTDNTEYHIEIISDLIIDQQGTLLNHQWDFTSATLETCLCAPWIANLNPDQGSKGQCLSVIGSCFTGTRFQSATPTNLEFILNETSTEATINGYDRNYLTTMVPSNYSDGDRPQVQATITYDTGETLTSNQIEFLLNSDDQATGPCLFSLDPSAGFPDKTTTDLKGIRFGLEGPASQVKFYPEKIVSQYVSWSSILINDALVPEGAQTGQVVVINDVGTSNALPFTILENPLPIITSITPDQGTNDPILATYITIKGQNFGSRPKGRFVQIGDYQAEIGCANWSDQTIIVIVPEELNMGDDAAVKIVDPEWGNSNEVIFQVRDVFHPGICQLNPNYGQTNDRITIVGTNFSDQQGDNYIIFGQQTINDLDENDWSNTEIKISVPEVPETESNVVVYVASPIETGNPLKPSNPVPFYQSPIIESITPGNGPRGTWVTIRGQNFLSVPGLVYFKYNNIHYPASPLPDYCSSTWSNQEIIIEVPESLPIIPDAQNSYAVEVYVLTGAGINSNLVDWEVDKSPQSPALCSIDPDVALPGFSPLTIMGTRFDLGPEVFNRKLIFSFDQEVSSLTWISDGEINDILVPDEVTSGDVVVEKEVKTDCRLTCDGLLFGGYCFGSWVEICDQIWTRSNPLHFTLQSENGGPGPLGLPRVVEENSCSILPQSPSPWINYIDACSNAGISARFNQEVAGLNLNNIIVEKCNSGDESFDAQTCSLISGSISDISDGESFIFTPLNTLNRNYWYQVRLKSGLNGIENQLGNQLDGNKNGQENGSPIDDYQWHFKTKDQAASCSAESVLVNEVVPEGETPGFIVYPGERDYSASVIGPDCQILVGGLTWTWTSSNISVATVTQKSEPSQARATAQTLGETEIQALAQPDEGTPQTGEKVLRVTTNPLVIDNNPIDGQTNVCRNILITATFNQLMDHSTISDQTVEILGQTITDLTVFDNEDNRTVVNFYSDLFNKDQTYTVVIHGGSNGVKNQYGFPMAGDHSFAFTAGDDICQLSQVTVAAVFLYQPETSEIVNENTVLFTQKDNQGVFHVTGQDQFGNPLGRQDGVYTWDWSWDSSDNTVATISDSTNRTETVTAQNKNGLANITATATIMVDSINTPRTTGNEISGQGLAQVFLCENSWSYQEPVTHFEFLYCRDGDPLLPLLRQIGFLEPPSNLSAIALTSSEINITWEDNSNNEEKFEIQRGVMAEGGAELGYNFPQFDFQIAGHEMNLSRMIWTTLEPTLESNSILYNDPALEPETEYFYRTRACNAAGCSKWSRQISVFTLPPPPARPSLSMTPVSSTQIDLFWNNVAKETRYEIEKEDTSGRLLGWTPNNDFHIAIEIKQLKGEDINLFEQGSLTTTETNTTTETTTTIEIKQLKGEDINLFEQEPLTTTETTTTTETKQL